MASIFNQLNKGMRVRFNSSKNNDGKNFSFSAVNNIIGEKQAIQHTTPLIHLLGNFILLNLDKQNKLKGYLNRNGNELINSVQNYTDYYNPNNSSLSWNQSSLFNYTNKLLTFYIPQNTYSYDNRDQIYNEPAIKREILLPDGSSEILYQETSVLIKMLNPYMYKDNLALIECKEEEIGKYYWESMKKILDNNNEDALNRELIASYSACQTLYDQDTIRRNTLLFEDSFDPVLRNASKWWKQNEEFEFDENLGYGVYLAFANTDKLNTLENKLKPYMGNNEELVKGVNSQDELFLRSTSLSYSVPQLSDQLFNELKNHNYTPSETVINAAAENLVQLHGNVPINSNELTYQVKNNIASEYANSASLRTTNKQISQSSYDYRMDQNLIKDIHNSNEQMANRRKTILGKNIGMSI